MDDDYIFLIEERLVERLQPLNQVLDYLIEAFPDDAEALGNVYSYGRILVGYQRENFTQPQNLNPNARMVQERTFEYEIQINAKNLRTARGAYKAIGLIRKSLTGFQPLLPEGDVKRLYPTRSGFVKITNNKVWVYSMGFSLSTTYTTDVRVFQNG